MSYLSYGLDDFFKFIRNIALIVIAIIIAFFVFYKKKKDSKIERVAKLYFIIGSTTPKDSVYLIYDKIDVESIEIVDEYFKDRLDNE